MTSHCAFLSLAFVALTACASGEGVQQGPDVLTESNTLLGQQERPPEGQPGACWGKAVRPAVIETVTEQILVEPAERDAEGNVIRPAIYRTETQQNIVREREDTWFEALCPDVFSAEFVASVQRALKARSVYLGRISGVMDARTRTAIRRYQEPRGLDSGILALETARQFGLIAVERGS